MILLTDWHLSTVEPDLIGKLDTWRTPEGNLEIPDKDYLLFLEKAEGIFCTEYSVQIIDRMTGRA